VEFVFNLLKKIKEIKTLSFDFSVSPAVDRTPVHYPQSDQNVPKAA
jgi:hypothetical protein